MYIPVSPQIIPVGEGVTSVQPVSDEDVGTTGVELTEGTVMLVRILSPLADGVVSGNDILGIIAILVAKLESVVETGMLDVMPDPGTKLDIVAEDETPLDRVCDADEADTWAVVVAPGRVLDVNDAEQTGETLDCPLQTEDDVVKDLRVEADTDKEDSELD